MNKLNKNEVELVCKAILSYGQGFAMGQSSYEVGLLPKLDIILKKLGWVDEN